MKLDRAQKRQRSHFLRSVATMRLNPIACVGRLACNLTEMTLLFASSSFTTASSAAMIERMAKHYDQYCPVAHSLDVVATAGPCSSSAS